MTNEFLLNFINIGFNVFYFLILIRVLMSWLPQMSGNPLGRAIIEVTDPILKPLKKIIPNLGPIDISPIIALLLLSALQSLLTSFLS